MIPIKITLVTGEVIRLQIEAEESRREPAAGQSSGKNPVEPSVEFWLARINLLKERVAQKPEAKIPEFQFLTGEDWLNVAQKDLGAEIVERHTPRALHHATENRLVSRLQPALWQYIQANNSQFPTDLRVVTQKCPMDEDNDSRIVFSPSGRGNTGFKARRHLARHSANLAHLYVSTKSSS